MAHTSAPLELAYIRPHVHFGWHIPCSVEPFMKSTKITFESLLAAAFVLVGSAPFAQADYVFKKPFPEPAPLTALDRTNAAKDLAQASLYDDVACKFSQDEIASTRLKVTDQDAGVCAGRDREILFVASTHGLYLCEKSAIKLAMRVSIGSNGIAKEVEGDRKTPLGTYWLGLPRSSKYGIFIPVGYPNEADLQAGRTGSDIGIHGPLRIPIFVSACSLKSNISKDWTAGCISVARDTQIIFISEWVMKNWPVKLLSVATVEALPAAPQAQN